MTDRIIWDLTATDRIVMDLTATDRIVWANVMMTDWAKICPGIAILPIAVANPFTGEAVVGTPGRPLAIAADVEIGAGPGTAFVSQPVNPRPQTAVAVTEPEPNVAVTGLLTTAAASQAAYARSAASDAQYAEATCVPLFAEPTSRSHHPTANASPVAGEC